VLSYVDVLAHRAPVGASVAIIGAGGIGFDVAEFLSHGPDAPHPSLDVPAFMAEWGVDMTLAARGGLATDGGHVPPSARQIWLLQRKPTAPGRDLGKTTGWIHRTALKRRGVRMLAGVSYEGIDDAGLHVGGPQGREVLEVDNVIVCAGQDPLRELQAPLEAAGVRVHLVGGAKLAAELDAKRAIDEGARLAVSF
jgi:2,4-dienoyl-CoA reductase (NADPH2)